MCLSMDFQIAAKFIDRMQAGYQMEINWLSVLFY